MSHVEEGVVLCKKCHRRNKVSPKARHCLPCHKTVYKCVYYSHVIGNCVCRSNWLFYTLFLVVTALMAGVALLHSATSLQRFDDYPKMSGQRVICEIDTSGMIFSNSLEEDELLGENGEEMVAAVSSGRAALRSSRMDKLDVISDEEHLRIEMLELLSDETEDETMLRDALEEEAAKVSDRMSNADKPLPFDYCRLGSICRKLGQLKSARLNLDEAINLEPQLVDAYWQRHLLFLLQGKRAEALEDLNLVLKLNRNHAGAYVSRADLVSDNDVTMAVTDLNNAVNLRPNNADIYMRRANLYEKRGQILLAMEDYAKAYRLRL